MGNIVARQLSKKFKNARIAILEMENNLFTHNSSRNSAVIHSGIYYRPGSLKAELCIKGADLLREYCEENSIELQNTGKLIVPTNPEEEKRMHDLYERAKLNGVSARIVSREEAIKLEPFANLTQNNALFIEHTGLLGSLDILNNHIFNEVLQNKNISFEMGCRMERLLNYTNDGVYLQTSNGNIETRFLVNTAGCNSLKIARQFGFAENYSVLPLRGFYLKADISSKHIYNYRAKVRRNQHPKEIDLSCPSSREQPIFRPA